MPLEKGVLALSLRAGWVEAYGESRSASAADIGIEGVPFEYLFQAGGSSTVRGFDNYSLGTPLVVTQTDVSSGQARVDTVNVNAGTVLLLGNVELRRPAPLLGRWQIGMALFLDVGNVWRDFAALQHAVCGPRFESPYLGTADLRYGCGFGLRYPTPFGPIRIDLGLPLKRAGRREFHLAVGNPF
jgi:outer membrane protein assembly factor BamA